jgi:hypothetical protein
MFLSQDFSSPWRSAFFILISNVLVLLFTSCQSDRDPVAPVASTDGPQVQIADAPGVPESPRVLADDLVLPMVERFATPVAVTHEPFDPDRGWVNLNTTASGMLIGVAHLQGARPNAEFFVNVRVRYEDGTTDVFTDVATLTTNEDGNGNASVRLNVMPHEGETTLRRVAVRVRKTTPPNVLYLAVAWDVPLK